MRTSPVKAHPVEPGEPVVVCRFARRVSVIAATIVAAATAVVHAAGAERPRSATNETDTVKVKPAGVSLEVPSPWIRADLTKASLNQLADALAAQNPERAEQIREFSGFADEGSKFFAIDLTTGNGVNVLVGSGAGYDLPSDLSSFSDGYKTDGLNPGDTLLTVERVKVGGKAAFRTLVNTSTTSPTGERTAQLVGQLILRHGDDLVVVTVGTVDDEPGLQTISDVLGSVQSLSHKASERPGKSQV